MGEGLGAGCAREATVSEVDSFSWFSCTEISYYSSLPRLVSDMIFDSNISRSLILYLWCLLIKISWSGQFRISKLWLQSCIVFIIIFSSIDVFATLWWIGSSVKTEWFTNWLFCSVFFFLQLRLLIISSLYFTASYRLIKRILNHFIYDLFDRIPLRCI